MPYTVLLSEAAKTQLAVIKKSGDKPTLKKIASMLVELQEHPAQAPVRWNICGTMPLRKHGRAASTSSIA